MTNIRKEIKALRRDFEYGSLSVSEVPQNPFQLLKNWLKDAIDLQIKDANAFVLSTSLNNIPDSRVLLMRDIREESVCFYTNYLSKKSIELLENPHAAVNIFWAELDRQVRMRVLVKKMDSQISDAYFKSRPRESKIGAWASKQSSELESRELLEERVKKLHVKFEGIEVPRPDFWGGFELIPDYFEFWQGRKSRLHDRVVYEKNKHGWTKKRLYP